MYCIFGVSPDGQALSPLLLVHPCHGNDDPKAHTFLTPTALACVHTRRNQLQINENINFLFFNNSNEYQHVMLPLSDLLMFRRCHMHVPNSKCRP